MTPGSRTIAAVACLTASLLLLPDSAEAQRRRAVPRGAPPSVAVLRSRPPVRVGIYYGPSVYYRSWYASPYYWYDPFYSYPYYYGYYGRYPRYYGYGYGYGYGYDVSASLRLRVTPRHTEVFVNGYFAGTVDDFDGVFQRLHLEPGEHDLELFLPGHRSLQQKVYLQPGRTFTVRHTMEPLGAGDPEPARPSVSAARPDPRPAAPRGLPPPRRDPDAVRDQVAAPRSEFGELSLRVQPGDASITIDGEAWERSAERLIVQLGAGLHTVEIRKDGYRTYITDVTVRTGETTTLNVAMTPEK